MSLLHRESFPAQRAGWILSYSLDQFSGRASMLNSGITDNDRLLQEAGRAGVGC